VCRKPEGGQKRYFEEEELLDLLLKGDRKRKKKKGRFEESREFLSLKDDDTELWGPSTEEICSCQRRGNSCLSGDRGRANFRKKLGLATAKPDSA